MDFNWVSDGSMGDCYLTAGMTQKQMRTEKLIAIWMMTHEYCKPKVFKSTCEEFSGSMYPLCAAGFKVSFPSF